jgi:hypothetical protein
VEEGELSLVLEEAKQYIKETANIKEGQPKNFEKPILLHNVVSGDWTIQRQPLSNDRNIPYLFCSEKQVMAAIKIQFSFSAML